MRWIVTGLLASGAMFAQSAPLSCPADRPVDDIIAEVHKEQSKEKERNTNPLPQIYCSWGWCHDASTTPPTIPEPAPRAEVTGHGNATPTTATLETCGDAMKMALEAAHNVEIGDYSFGEKNFSGALLRYKDALEEKPGDPAIHVRLARVFEKLNRIPQAIEQYNIAQRFPGPKKWSDEAKSALQRLQRAPSP